MVIHLSYIVINILCILCANGQIVMKGAGTAKIQPTDIGMIFYLTLENICPTEMFISVRGVKCCEINTMTGTNDCESMNLIGGDPGLLSAGKTRNVTLIYPNLYLYGRQGYCTILVVYKVGAATKHFFHSISFNTKGSFHDLSMKRCPCYTSDLDPFRNCSPVDCPIKYSGHKNFFNSLTRYCEPVPYCKSQPGCAIAEEMYDILHNRCVNIQCTVTSKDLAVIEEKSLRLCPVPYIFGNMICHHGRIDKKTGNCICYDDWVSTVTNEPEFPPSLISSHMCNIRTGSWTELNRDKLLLTILVMVIMTSLCVLKLFFLICILHFCYKWARSKHKFDSNKSSQPHTKICRGVGSLSADFGRSYETTKRNIKLKAKKWSDDFNPTTCQTRKFGITPSIPTACPCPPKKFKSQAALAKTEVMDRVCQLKLANFRCETLASSTTKKVDELASKSSFKRLHSQELLKSGESDSSSEASLSVFETTSTELYPAGYSYLPLPRATPTSSPRYDSSEFSESSEATTQTNFSINMEYDDSGELQLECLSSSDV